MKKILLSLFLLITLGTTGFSELVKNGDFSDKINTGALVKTSTMAERLPPRLKMVHSFWGTCSTRPCITSA